MSELLFVAHRFPFPPNKGERIRSWHFLRHLAGSRTVHLACLSDERIDPEHASVVENLCAERHVEPLERSPLQWRNLRALASGRPISCSHFYRRTLARWIEELLSRRPIDTVFACSGAMAQYVPPAAGASPRRIIDFVDVDSEKWRQYAKRALAPRRYLYLREARVLRAYEQRTARAFDATLFVSESEAELFRHAHPDCRDKVVTVENGVDVNGYRPDQQHDRPNQVDGRTLVFVGHMDYWPNIDAVTWFARDVLPRIRSRHPDIGLAVVGADPGEAVRRLGSQEGVRIVGAVPEIQPYLAHGVAAVVPLRVSPGIPNKVLEAMAMAKPVVTTSAAIKGLDHVEPDRHLLVGDDAASLAVQVLRILDDQGLAEALGQEARRCVLAHYTWEQSYRKLDRLLDEAPRPSDSQ